MKATPIKDQWALPLRGLLLAAFGEFYRPLLNAFPKENSNPREALEHAFHIGKIRYVDGVFIGEISADISLYLKERGAIWDYTTRGWRLPLTALPVRVSQIVEQYAKKDDTAKKFIVAALGMAPLIIDAFLSGDALAKVSEDILEKVTTASGLPPAPEIPIPAAASPFDIRVRDVMQRTTQKEINKILRDMDKIIKKGGSLEEYIVARSQIAESKAKAIARAEMGKEANIVLAQGHIAEGRPYYMWHTKGDGDVRPIHRDLDKTIQRWDNPPIAGKGFRGHPGEAANCRCEAIPLERT